MTAVGVLDKVMAVLRAFPDGRRALLPAEVAASTGLPLPTVYRLLRAMAEHGLVEEEGAGFRLGVTLLHLGSRVAEAIDLRGLALPHLTALRDQTRENAELHVLHDGSRVPIEVVESPSYLRTMGRVGQPLPMHKGASAKVLLAWLSPERRRQVLERSMASHGGDDSFDPAAWDRELDRTARQGWAESEGEREPDLYACAAPVRDASGAVVAAVVPCGPLARVGSRRHRQHIVQPTQEAASRLSAQLGHVAGDISITG